MIIELRFVRVDVKIVGIVNTRTHEKWIVKIPDSGKNDTTSWQELEFTEQESVTKFLAWLASEIPLYP